MDDELVFGAEEAEQYEAWFLTKEGQRVDRLEKQLMLRCLEDLGEPGTMLEVACGTGHFSRYFEQDLGWTVTGLDISQPMIDQARSLDPAFPVALADAADLPFPDNSYDTVVIITALEFMRDPVIALREAIRVARRGIVVGTLNRWSLVAIWRRLVGLFVSTPYDSARFLSAAELRHLFALAAPGMPLETDTRTAVWPRSLSVFELTRGPWGAFLAMRVRFKGDPPGAAGDR